MLGPGISLFLAAAFSGCPFFAGSGYYTQPVTQAAIDINSAKYISSMLEAGDTGGFWAAARPVEYINVAIPSTQPHRVRQKVSYHRFDAPIPWSDNFRIEPLSDAHAIVIAPQTCDLYETYDTTFADGELSAYSGAHWTLRRPFVPLPPGTPSAMASGLSLYAGMIRWEEVASGSIDHALDWETLKGTVAQWDFVRPASDTDWIPFKGHGRYQLPYGAHLRLHASFDASTFGPQSAAIVRAMKTYGIYLADTGSSGNGLYNAVPMDGGDHWNAWDLASLNKIRISDFDVLSLGKIERVPGH
jgi:hypothetical protein